jgi:type IV pilus assembly protein PilA
MKKYLYSGFTLIEILIVIAVIGILVAVAVPNYQQYIKEAKKSACLAEVKNYSNNVFYVLNDENDSSTLPVTPVITSCQSITDATGWTLQTQQKIIAVAKSPSNARIECDIPNGSPCRITP